MTLEQRNTIILLRRRGISYPKISEQTGVSVNTIKALFHRIAIKEKEDESGRCKQCGKPVQQMPGTKKKKFCCGKCRQKWWNEHPEEVVRRANYDFVCAHCGKPFTAYGNAHRKYCSHECYIMDRFYSGGEPDE
ncbi:MAG: RNA polymerase subunit sigma-70 [Lachnospiraceae bacterium]|nr:RNA polymerase subunit sigma-70 [Lachnospiraceae bacterium]